MLFSNILKTNCCHCQLDIYSDTFLHVLYLMQCQKPKIVFTYHHIWKIDFKAMLSSF